MPKSACTSTQDQINRLENRRSGRIVRASIAGILSVPLIVWPIVDTAVSALSNTETTANDNVMNEGMSVIPQEYQANNNHDNISDILKAWEKAASLILGLGLVSFAAVRANDAKIDGKKIGELKLGKESRDHLKGRVIFSDRNPT